MDFQIRYIFSSQHTTTTHYYTNSSSSSCNSSSSKEAAAPLAPPPDGSYDLSLGLRISPSLSFTSGHTRLITVTQTVNTGHSLNFSSLPLQVYSFLLCFTTHPHSLCLTASSHPLWPYLLSLSHFASSSSLHFLILPLYHFRFSFFLTVVPNSFISLTTTFFFLFYPPRFLAISRTQEIHFQRPPVT